MRRALFLWMLTVLSGVCSAQFKKGAIGIGGRMSWERAYWNHHEGTSIFTLKPDAQFFLYDNIAVVVNINTLIYVYPSDWGGSSDIDAGFGLGGKYCFRYFYGGLSFQFMQWNHFEPRMHLLVETGYLVKLNEKVCLDIGLDYQKGISEINRNNENIKMEIGVVVFL